MGQWTKLEQSYRAVKFVLTYSYVLHASSPRNGYGRKVELPNHSAYELSMQMSEFSIEYWLFEAVVWQRWIKQAKLQSCKICFGLFMSYVEAVCVTVMENKAYCTWENFVYWGKIGKFGEWYSIHQIFPCQYL